MVSLSVCRLNNSHRIQNDINLLAQLNGPSLRLWCWKLFYQDGKVCCTGMGRWACQRLPLALGWTDSRTRRSTMQEIKLMMGYVYWNCWVLNWISLWHLFVFCLSSEISVAKGDRCDNALWLPAWRSKTSNNTRPAAAYSLGKKSKPNLLILVFSFQC